MQNLCHRKRERDDKEGEKRKWIERKREREEKRDKVEREVERER